MSHLILVLGMHRSGTSLVAKSLECLGISLGDRSDWNAPDNPLGFFEDLDVLALDEEVLRRFGVSWDTVSWKCDKSVILSDLTAHAKRILKDKLTRWPLFGIKEPRMCRLLPFWKPVFKAVGCKVSVVEVWRNPGPVCKSLEKRNGMDYRHARELFDAYNAYLAAGLADTGWPLAKVSYNSMTGSPETEVRFIGEKLGLGVDDNKLRWFCDNFVQNVGQ